MTKKGVNFFIPSLFMSNGDGTLMVYEKEKLPFLPKRIFFVHKVPKGSIRGQHAHLKCEQLLIVMNGKVEIEIDDGKNKQVVILESPNQSLFLPKLTWSYQKTLSRFSTLCVLASINFDETEYIYDYKEFQRIANQISPLDG